MNLQEQINRTKTLMGLQPINEGMESQSGSFEDLFTNIFKSKPKDAELSPLQTKYGNISSAPSKVEMLRLKLDKQEQDTFTQDFLTVSIITTTDPQPLPSDPNKKVTQENYSVKLQETVNGQQVLTQYFKSLYLIDNQVTDFNSQVTINNQDTCTSFSLSGGGEQCQLPQELKDNILEKFKNDKDIEQLKSFLDKMK